MTFWIKTTAWNPTFKSKTINMFYFQSSSTRFITSMQWNCMSKCTDQTLISIQKRWIASKILKVVCFVCFRCLWITHSEFGCTFKILNFNLYVAINHFSSIHHFFPSQTGEQAQRLRCIELLSLTVRIKSDLFKFISQTFANLHVLVAAHLALHQNENASAKRKSRKIEVR